MKKTIAILILGVMCSAALADDAVVTPPEGFTALFNGKDLTGWHGAGQTFDPARLAAMSPEDRAKWQEKEDASFKANWRVENGELVNDGRGSYAGTIKQYGDFELLIEYNTVAKADSGIYLRGTPQVQIWDYTKEGGKWGIGADKGSGGLWNNKKHAADPLVLADKPFGEWNQLRIVIKGDVVNVWLNGQQVVKDTVMENYYDRSKPLPAVGDIQLQTHGGQIRWRNIFIKEL